jgi:PAS domain S-box-containing protein
LEKRPRVFKSYSHTTEFYTDMWKTLTGGKSFQCSICNLKKDKTPYWSDCNITPIRNENSEIIGYLAIQTDITDKRQTDLEFQVILESMEGCVALFDKNAVFTKILPNGEWWGMTKEDIIGKKITEVLPERYSDAFMQIFDKIDSGDHGPHISYMKINVDNVPRTIENVVRRFNSNKFVVWGRDITDKLRLRVLDELETNIEILIESNKNIMNKLGVKLIDEGTESIK